MYEGMKQLICKIFGFQRLNDLRFLSMLLANNNLWVKQRPKQEGMSYEGSVLFEKNQD